MLYLVLAPFHFGAFCVVAVVGGLVSKMTGANIKVSLNGTHYWSRCSRKDFPSTPQALVLNVNLPETRGVASGIFGLTDNLGSGFGPTIIVFLEQVPGGGVTSYA